jgi:hypothetical protein
MAIAAHPIAIQGGTSDNGSPKQPRRHGLPPDGRRTRGLTRNLFSKRAATPIRREAGLNGGEVGANCAFPCKVRSALSSPPLVLLIAAELARRRKSDAPRGNLEHPRLPVDLLLPTRPVSASDPSDSGAPGILELELSSRHVPHSTS